MRGVSFIARGWQARSLEGGGLSLSASGALASTEGEAAVRQALMMLLSTRKGERVMRPDYGCALDRLVFLPNDATTAGLAIHYVREAVERWERRIDVERLDADPGAESFELVIELDYRIRSTNGRDAIAVSVGLQGDAS